MASPKRPILKGLVAVGAGLVLVIPVLVFGQKKPHPAPVSEVPPKARGAESAALEILEYSDFQCPACSSVQIYLKKLLEEHPGEIRLVFRHYPLQRHRNAPLAHQAAECAHDQGNFWAYHDRLYSEQDSWAEDHEPARRMLQYARDLGLNLEQFSGCLENLEVTDRIKIELTEGKAQGVSSTPSFFIQSKMAVGEKQLREAVDGWVRDRAKNP